MARNIYAIGPSAGCHYDELLACSQICLQQTYQVLPCTLQVNHLNSNFFLQRGATRPIHLNHAQTDAWTNLVLIIAKGKRPPCSKFLLTVEVVYHCKSITYNFLFSQDTTAEF